jgi:hypothetical protein
MADEYENISETRRQRILRLLEETSTSLDLKTLLKEFEYATKNPSWTISKELPGLSGVKAGSSSSYRRPALPVDSCFLPETSVYKFHPSVRNATQSGLLGPA